MIFNHIDKGVWVPPRSSFIAFPSPQKSHLIPILQSWPQPLGIPGSVFYSWRFAFPGDNWLLGLCDVHEAHAHSRISTSFFMVIIIIIIIAE